MKKMKHSNRLIVVFIIVFSLCLTRCSTDHQANTQPRDVGSTADAAAVDRQEANPENPQSIDDTSGNVQESENLLDLMEQALETYQEALTAREKGDNESALEALDEAYGIIIKLKASQDSSLFQEKNDLRLMIAQRIREIYASHHNEVINNHKSIPLTENQYVLAEIKSFQTKERKYFLEGYKRSGRYRDMILLKLKNAGLPDELSWIPMIESWFKVRAYSRARALGIWQFISSTGYRFGLKRDRWVDERMDPAKSTRAAVKYLNELHNLFGDWTTALASYNCGEFQVQRVIRNQRLNYLDNFWDLFIMLPRETARFVPRFIATLLIIRNPEKYGFELPEPDPPITYEIVLINRPVKLSTLSQTLGLGKNDLAGLNPELRHNATPAREYHLKVPVGAGRQALSVFQKLSRWIPPAASYIIHRVRRGETVSGIARRYRTSISAIARLNRLRRNYMIRPGQRLKIPARSARF
jgi:membrane-bound lytic murein transglycosylase D